MIKSNLHLLGELRKFLKESSNNSKYKQNEKDFTRTRKFNIEIIVMFICSLPRHTLALELYSFFNSLGGLKPSTTSGFTKARKKLKHIIFKDWLAYLVHLCYEKELGGSAAKWKEFILLAIDGSTLQLPTGNNKELVKYFGKHSKGVLARVVNCFDVLNKISIKSVLIPFKTSERQIAMQWISELAAMQKRTAPILMLYDRGFPGFAFFCKHMKKKLNFLARCRPNFNKEISAFTHSYRVDQIIKIKVNSYTKSAAKKLHKMTIAKGTVLTIRLIKVKLDNGEIEILATSLLDKKKYPYSTFKSLYFKRWGIETNFDYWKNKLKLAHFSGLSVEAVLQDFHATVFTGNIHLLTINDCDKKVKIINKKRKLNYAINRNITAGLFKPKVALIFLKESIVKLYKDLKKAFITYLLPIRLSRKYLRKVMLRIAEISRVPINMRDAF